MQKIEISNTTNRPGRQKYTQPPTQKLDRVLATSQIERKEPHHHTPGVEHPRLIQALESCQTATICDGEKNSWHTPIVVRKKKDAHNTVITSTPDEIQALTVTVDTAYPQRNPEHVTSHIVTPYALPKRVMPVGSAPPLWQRLTIYMINTCCGCLGTLRPAKESETAVDMDTAREVTHNKNGTISVTEYDPFGRRWDYQLDGPARQLESKLQTERGAVVRSI